MENASKAILIAGGVLLTIIVVALVLIAFNSASDYYETKENLAEIDDVTKFNLQFTNYDRNDVHGYEIISLCNKIADYNERISEEGRNDKKDTPITLVVNLNKKDSEDVVNLSPDDSQNRLFTITPCTQSSTINALENILNTAIETENVYGGTEVATKLAKSIKSLILDEEMYDTSTEEGERRLKSDKIAAVRAYNRIVKKLDMQKGESETGYGEMCNALMKNDIYKYYEYYQFKRLIFKCSGIEYDNNSGKVKRIEFKFVSIE